VESFLFFLKIKSEGGQAKETAMRRSLPSCDQLLEGAARCRRSTLVDFVALHTTFRRHQTAHQEIEPGVAEPATTASHRAKTRDPGT
jgi:hypothetical protein